MWLIAYSNQGSLCQAFSLAHPPRGKGRSSDSVPSEPHGGMCPWDWLNILNDDEVASFNLASQMAMTNPGVVIKCTLEADLELNISQKHVEPN